MTIIVAHIFDIAQRTHTHTCMDINDKYRTNFCRWCHCTEILKGRRYLMEWTVLVIMLHPTIPSTVVEDGRSETLEL